MEPMPILCADGLLNSWPILNTASNIMYKRTIKLLSDFETSTKFKSISSLVSSVSSSSSEIQSHQLDSSTTPPQPSPRDIPSIELNSKSADHDSTVSSSTTEHESGRVSIAKKIPYQNQYVFEAGPWLTQEQNEARANTITIDRVKPTSFNLIRSRSHQQHHAPSTHHCSHILRDIKSIPTRFISLLNGADHMEIQAYLSQVLTASCRCQSRSALTNIDVNGAENIIQLILDILTSYPNMIFKIRTIREYRQRDGERVVRFTASSQGTRISSLTSSLSSSIRRDKVQAGLAYDGLKLCRSHVEHELLLNASPMQVACKFEIKGHLYIDESAGCGVASMDMDTYVLEAVELNEAMISR
jgi:hypothetical protein